jgi:toxin ParE1/3/4
VRVIFTPLAERHIDSLHEYIATHASEERADGYVSRIVDFCNGLSTFPLRGTQRDDLLPGLRVTGFERRVTIAFVGHGGCGAHRGHFLWRPGFRGGVSRPNVKVGETTRKGK